MGGEGGKKGREGGKKGGEGGKIKLHKGGRPRKSAVKLCFYIEHTCLLYTATERSRKHILHSTVPLQQLSSFACEEQINQGFYFDILYFQLWLFMEFYDNIIRYKTKMLLFSTF